MAARVVPVASDDPNLATLSETLQTLILDNGFVTAASVRGLCEAGVRNEHTFYLLGDENSAATSQSLLLPIGGNGDSPLGTLGDRQG